MNEGNVLTAAAAASLLCSPTRLFVVCRASIGSVCVSAREHACHRLTARISLNEGSRGLKQPCVAVCVSECVDVTHFRDVFLSRHRASDCDLSLPVNDTLNSRRRSSLSSTLSSTWNRSQDLYCCCCCVKIPLANRERERDELSRRRKKKKNVVKGLDFIKCRLALAAFGSFEFSLSFSS
jgi:hypothetical protein